MRWLRKTLITAIGWSMLAGPGFATAQPELTRAQAIKALEQPAPAERAAGIARLAEIGMMADADRLVPRLADRDEQVRELAGLAMWQIWGRSGDRAIDALFEQGVQQMEAADLQRALATFTTIIRRKPTFAEGWNKRATIHFLLGNNELSLKDCYEVLKRNRNHFGALSGMGQIYLNLGDPDHALEYFVRALKVNPNLPGVIEAVRVLEQRQADRRRRMI
jgi:tetratricopeptide (TPR) repeat protein